MPQDGDTGENNMTNTNTSNPFPYVESKKQTNYEKIKSMSIDEMTLLFCKGEFGC